MFERFLNGYKNTKKAILHVVVFKKYQVYPI